MSKLRILSVLVTVLAAVLFTIAATAQDEAQVAITLEHGVCLGECPVYTVTIYTDGRVVFVGERFTDVECEQTIQIEPEAVNQLIAGFEEAGFFEWDDEYTDMFVTDLPYITTSVTRDGVTKTIRRYAGDNSAPLALAYLETWIDIAAYTSQWTGVSTSFTSVMSVNTPVVTLERQACFGVCPVYSLAVYEDGTVVYVGLNHVVKTGVHITSIDPEQVEFLAIQTVNFGYFDWNDQYMEMRITDQSYVFSSLRWEDQYKQIQRYDGDFNAPIGLVRFENLTDELVNVNQWVKGA
jgi:hypothetical protein